MQTIFGLLVPFLGTSLGAACVFFLKALNKNVEKMLLGFAAGVMTAASIWSLLLPAIEDAASLGRFAFFPAAAGFAVGFSALCLLDRYLPEPELIPGGSKTGMMALAITLHNIPEGMAVGAGFAGTLSGSVPVAAAVALAAGIAIQNIPEGAIISLPLAGCGMKKGRAFALGVGSGAVEPVGAAVMLALTGLLEPLLPYCLSFAAGAMLYVVAEQLLPDVGGRRSTHGVMAFAVGFLVMMILDVALG
jgi:ZIP family zinc transporter